MNAKIKTFAVLAAVAVGLGLFGLDALAAIVGGAAGALLLVSSHKGDA
jgi:hypothetical protein